MLYILARSIFRLTFGFLFRLKSSGQENIPDDGPLIFCCNHTSNMDPLIMGTPIRRKVHYMAKEELFRIPVVGWLITQWGAFPVKRGGVSKESIKLAIQLLKNGKAMGIFPEGTRKNAGGMGKKGAAMLALRSNAIVIPVAIVGEYKLFRPIHVIYGKPVDLSEFAEGGSDQLEPATDKIMAVIRQIVTEHRNLGKN
jgi:1-acyl-sn-glycerol-3-phosphate acyltransferase